MECDPMNGLLTAAMVESGLITWRSLSQPPKMLPPPSGFVAVVIIFGGLSLLPASGAKFASYTGWGLVLATFLNLWSPATPTKLAVPGGTATVQAGTTPVVTPAPKAAS
jgi:hypothetical protein